MLGSMPAYGFYARNARAITLQNVRFQVSRPDLRPALVLHHVTDAAINSFSAEGNTTAESVLRIIDSEQVLLTAPRLLTPAATYLQVEGQGNRDIVLDGGDVSKAQQALSFKNGATNEAVKVRL
jgi:hypothetical protein